MKLLLLRLLDNFAHWAWCPFVADWMPLWMMGIGFAPLRFPVWTAGLLERGTGEKCSLRESSLS